MKNTTIIKRITNWFVYGVIFSILPLFCNIIVKIILNQIKGIESFFDSTELIFFSLYICSSSLADMKYFSKELELCYPTIYQLLHSLVTLLFVGSGILYGFIIFTNTMISSGNENSNINNLITGREKLFYSQIIISITCFIFTGIIQYLVGIIERGNDLEEVMENG